MVSIEKTLVDLNKTIAWQPIETLEKTIIERHINKILIAQTPKVVKMKIDCRKTMRYQVTCTNM